MLELRRRRQHIVRPVGRVRLEMLEHHREQVFASQATSYRVEIRSNSAGIRVVETSALTGGPPTPASGSVNASPNLIMLIVRVAGPASTRCSFVTLYEKFLLVESWTPPPARRQWPVIAGRHAIVRTAIPPPA